jgi:hypothetical protein
VTSSTGRSFIRRLLFLLAGPIIWFAHFSLIYSVAGFGGALGIAPEAIHLSAWAATVASSGAIFAILWRANSTGTPRNEETHREIYAMTKALAGLSLFAVILQAVVLWFIPS